MWCLQCTPYCRLGIRVWLSLFFNDLPLKILMRFPYLRSHKVAFLLVALSCRFPYLVVYKVVLSPCPLSPEGGLGFSFE